MRRSLVVAVDHYAHVGMLADQRGQADGLDLTYRVIPVAHVDPGDRQWDVAELSIAHYVAMRAEGRSPYVAIPVFPARAFCHGSILVRRGTLTDPSQLTGATIGLTDYVEPLGIWVRGILAEQYGVDLAKVKWVQAATDARGRKSRTCSPHVSRVTRPGTSLDDLLSRGEVDAVLTARSQDSFLATEGEIVPLIADHHARERAWWIESRIFPIMHVMALRREIYEQAPWIAHGLLTRFTEAKRRCVAALGDQAVSSIPVPWIPDLLAELGGRAGAREWWPYGVSENRATLETLLRYCRHQGITSDDTSPDDLFALETLADEVRV